MKKTRKYVLVRINPDYPREAFPLENCPDGVEIFDDLLDELGGDYLPARIIEESEIDVMEMHYGFRIARLPDNTPITILA